MPPPTVRWALSRIASAFSLYGEIAFEKIKYFNRIPFSENYMRKMESAIASCINMFFTNHIV